MNNKVSIVTVVYNNIKTVERCIKSVLAQDYKEIEYLIIDGGSTDGTVAVIEKYRSRIDYFRSQKDKGIYDAMNIGINNAKGDIIALLNSDDWYEKGAVSAAVDSFNKHKNVDIVHANIIEHKNSKSKVYRPITSSIRMLYQGMTYHHPTFFVRRRVYAHIVYDVKYRIGSDYKFTMECLREGFDFYHLDKGIVNVSYGGISSSSLWLRISEGHQIRMDLGYNWLLVWSSTIFRLALNLAVALKNNISAVIGK